MASGIPDLRSAAAEAGRTRTRRSDRAGAPGVRASKDSLRLTAAARSEAGSGFPSPVPLAALAARGETAFLGPGGSPRLVPIAPFHPGGKVVVFAHGILADPTQLGQLVADAQARGDQVWVLAYRTVGARLDDDARGFSHQLRQLAEQRGVRDVTIVGHSLGGMVAKGALVDLTGRDGNLQAFDHVRLVGLAVPWGGAAIADVARKVPDSWTTLAAFRDLAPDGDYWPKIAEARLPPQVDFDNVKPDTDEVALAMKGSASVGTLYADVLRDARENVTVHASGHMSMLGTLAVRQLVGADRPLEAGEAAISPQLRDHLKALLDESSWTKDLSKTILTRGGLSAQADPALLGDPPPIEPTIA